MKPLVLKRTAKKKGLMVGQPFFLFNRVVSQLLCSREKILLPSLSGHAAYQKASHPLKPFSSQNH